MNPFDLKLMVILVIAIALYRSVRFLYKKYIHPIPKPFSSSRNLGPDNAPQKFSPASAKRYTRKFPDYAYYAVRSAKKQFDINLDYSPQSIERLDDILTQIHTHFHAGNIPAEELASLIPYWAAYLGQTLIKTNPTLHLKWDFVPDSKNNPVYFIQLSETKTIHPFHLIEKRIITAEPKSIHVQFA
ncbi:hypothetical protein KS4_35050 [Poriferisphaera corsica]|uniref:Uncharacterized protein n=1 Tax=Poriferisphaera corsica TaxID=2528020 RepID=A0A517YYW8_9BACT|nr:hypothetical protein [Poriferisphaera corsica]QDU35424.1 hypothetical protein KS4_35050 [Poriferisphaera corsica]